MRAIRPLAYGRARAFRTYSCSDRFPGMRAWTRSSLESPGVARQRSVETKEREPRLPALGVPQPRGVRVVGVVASGRQDVEDESAVRSRVRFVDLPRPE